MSGYTSEPVNKFVTERSTGIPYAAPLRDERERRFVRDITDAYGPVHAFRLSQRTHEPGTPWDKTIRKKGQYAEIDEKLMRDHFAELREIRGIDRNQYRH
ncbi:hypothetical protein [Fulvimarina pelagi]|uniref:hypothetical protein n=1 Tax=Fulvimarina pelagi TaxID=217511 RepID=UPI0034E2D392